jgi:acyl-CoA synthetase (AMP-forming)/AMP-acid ligase II
MKHFSKTAENLPDKIAVIVEDDLAVSYAQLNQASIAFGNYIHDLGLDPSKPVAVLMENRYEYIVCALTLLRMGLQLVPINSHLKRDEIIYIVNDSNAALLITSDMHKLACIELSLTILNVDDDKVWDNVTREMNLTVSVKHQFEQAEGQVLFYSSGTTGKPKGILRPVNSRPFGTPAPIEEFLYNYYKIDCHSVYLCPAPLYHAAPLNWTLSVLRCGGCVVVMPKFDAENALRLIDTYKVDVTQFVPTMFVRMLNLAETIKQRYSQSSLRIVAHAGAPCAPEIKHKMLDWWGMIIHEYYAGSETNGLTAITPEDWVKHPGSVGKAVLGALHICNDQGLPLPAGAIGQIYFSGLPPFSYKGDERKTQEAYNKDGWSTLGDIGYIDEDGFLYLKDRKSFMIISGGVNIYPLEVENTLMSFDQILDVAVIGMPHEELGEVVVAVVQLKDYCKKSAHLADAIIKFSREKIAHFKCPKQVIFMAELPRLPNGKLLKRHIKNNLLEATSSKNQYKGEI